MKSENGQDGLRAPSLRNAFSIVLLDYGDGHKFALRTDKFIYAMDSGDNRCMVYFEEASGYDYYTVYHTAEEVSRKVIQAISEGPVVI